MSRRRSWSPRRSRPATSRTCTTTGTGLVERFVSGWAGPEAVYRAISIRLGVPCHAGDTLTFSGHVTEEDGSDCVIAVVGRCSLGDHVTGTVRIDVPRRRP